MQGVEAPGLLTREGSRARLRLEELLLHRHVQMEDIETDAHGRIVAQVWADGENINETMAKLIQSLTLPRPAPPPQERKVDVPVDSVFRPAGPKRETESVPES